MKRRRLKVSFDGGCRPNPGPVEVAVVVRGVAHLFDDLGHGTNTDAEWPALNRAMELSQSMGLTDVEMIGDALEVIRKANRALERNYAIHSHEATFPALAAKVTPTRFRWIKSEQNLAGIALAAQHLR